MPHPQTRMMASPTSGHRARPGDSPIRAADTLVTPVVVPRRQSHPLRRYHRPFAQATWGALSPLSLRDHWYLRRLLETRRHESSLHLLPVTPLRRWLSSAVRCSHSRWLFVGRTATVGPPPGTMQYSNVGRGGQTGIMAPMQTRADSGRAPNLTAARELTIDEQHAGQRIDNFLMSRLKGLPRTRIYRILRRGEVRVNKGRIRQHYRLKPGDVVRIPPLRLVQSMASREPAMGLREHVEECVVFEDAGLIVLDKPSGVAVHGGSGHRHGIIETLRAARGEGHYLELVHRLDRDTSGCLMIAKCRPVLTALHAAFRHAQVRKRYLVLVQGHWRGGAREVEAGLRRNVLRSGERLVRVDAAGKIGRTRFVPRTPGQTASLMEALPFTGRTHQIRVHAASIGHPVAGDAKYGERAFNRRLRDHGLRRLFLHAARLDFANPADGSPLTIEAPLPAALVRVLASLGLDEEG